MGLDSTRCFISEQQLVREVTEPGDAKEKVPTHLTTEDVSLLEEFFFYY